MKVSFRVTGLTIVIDVEGPWSMTGGLGKLLDTIKKLISEGQKNFLLNLSKVCYLDSVGLGHLVRAYIAINNAGGSVKLIPSEKLLQLLVMTKLIEVFETYTDEPAALRSFTT